MKVKSDTVIEFNVSLELRESEARALLALTTYGSKQFLEAFYSQLGRVYMEEHEKGLVSLFTSIKQEIPGHLDRIDKTRAVFEYEKPKEVA